MAGKPLANGFYGVLCSLVGDLDYLNKTLQLPHHGKKGNCCSMCQAQGAGDATWKTFLPNAHWKTLIWQPSDWMAWAGRSKSCVFKILHLTGANVAADWMHCKYLGHDQYCLGSVVFLLIYHLMKEGSAKKNLTLFFRLLKEKYKEFNIKDCYGSFHTTSMFMNKKGIKLKGKAANIRALAKPLLAIWQSMCNEHLEVHSLVLVYLKLNCQIEDLLEDNFGNLCFSSWAAFCFLVKCFLIRVLYH